MKKYLIKDDDNMSYEITEVEEEETPKAEEQPLEDDALNDLAPEEISILKKLIPFADKLIALVSEEAPAEGDELEDDDDIDEFEEEDEEEIIDTDAQDSINKSATSSKKSKKVKDSEVEDIEYETSKSWADRYQQFKKGASEF